MTHFVSKADLSRTYYEWDVRHTIDGQWALTHMHDENYGNAFNCAEEVYDGQHWRPKSAVKVSEEKSRNGEWIKSTFTIEKE